MNHQSKTQVSSGRKSIGTRRKREIEATELMNVVQGQASEVQTSYSLAGPDSKPTEDYLAQKEHKKGSSKSSDSASQSLDRIDNQTGKVDAKAQEMKGRVLEEAVVSESEVAPDASVLDLTMEKCQDQSGKKDAKEQDMKGPVLDDAVLSESGETLSLEEKKFSTLKKAASVVDPEIEDTEKEVDVEAQESNGPILQEAVVSELEACEPENNINADSLENVADRRDLVKENLIVGTNMEGTSAVPLNADPSDDVPCEKSPPSDASVLDIKIDECEDQSRRQDVKEHGLKCLVLNETVVSESGVAETKSLEETFSTFSRLETKAVVVNPVIAKTQKEVDTEAYESIDPILQEAAVSMPEVCELETKLDASSFENLTDRRDLAEKNLIVGTNMEGTSPVPLNADPSDAVLCEKPVAPDVSVLDLTVDKHEDHGKEDAKEKMKAPLKDEAVIPELWVAETESLEEKQFSTLSMLTKAAPVVDPEIEKTQNEVNERAQESNDPIFQEAAVSKPEGCEPETELQSLENVADPRDLPKVNSIVGTVDGSSAAPLNADPSENVPHEKPLTPVASVVETATSALDLTMDKREDHGKEDEKDQKLRSPLLDEAVVPDLGLAETNRSLEEVMISTLEKAAPISYPEIEKTRKEVNAKAAVVAMLEACEPETKVEAGSSETVADPRDLAKENLMVGTNVEDISAVPFSADPSEHVPFGKPPTPDASILETAASILDLTVEKCEDQSGKDDAKEQEREDTVPVPDEGLVSEPTVTENQSLEERTSSTLETASPNVDPPHEKPETQPNASSSENMGDSKHLVEENLIRGANMEVTPAVPLKPISNDDVPHEETLTLDASLNSSSSGGSSIQTDSPLAPEGAKESSSAAEKKSVPPQ